MLFITIFNNMSLFILMVIYCLVFLQNQIDARYAFNHLSNLSKRSENTPNELIPNFAQNFDKSVSLQNLPNSAKSYNYENEYLQSNLVRRSPNNKLKRDYRYSNPIGIVIDPQTKETVGLIENSYDSFDGEDKTKLYGNIQYTEESQNGNVMNPNYIDGNYKSYQNYQMNLNEPQKTYKSSLNGLNNYFENEQNETLYKRESSYTTKSPNNKQCKNTNEQKLLLETNGVNSKTSNNNELGKNQNNQINEANIKNQQNSLHNRMADDIVLEDNIDGNDNPDLENQYEGNNLNKRHTGHNEDENLEEKENNIELVKRNYLNKINLSVGKNIKKRETKENKKNETNISKNTNNAVNENTKSKSESKLRNKRQSKEISSDTDMVKSLENSGDLKVSGNKSPLASSGEITQNHQQEKENIGKSKRSIKEEQNHEKNIEEQIQAKIEAIKQQVKREIAAQTGAVHGINDYIRFDDADQSNEEGRKKRSSEEEVNSSKEVNVDINNNNQDVIRTKRDLDEDDENPALFHRYKRANAVLPYNEAAFLSYRADNEDDEDEGNEFDDDGFDDRTSNLMMQKRQVAFDDVYGKNQRRYARNNHYGQQYAVPDKDSYDQQERDFLFDDKPDYGRHKRGNNFKDDSDLASFHGGGGGIASRAAVKNRNTHVEPNQEKADGTYSVSNFSPDKGDVTSFGDSSEYNDIFGALPQSYHGELTRLKRVKRDN